MKLAPISRHADFDRLAREFGPMIARIAAANEARPHLAEELVQEIYFAIWRALPSFRGQSSLRTFIARIASNRASTHVARALAVPHAAELGEEFADPAGGPEAAAVAGDFEDRLMTVVRDLPLLSRQIVTLTLEGFGPGEIAALLGISANAVSIRLLRCKDELRKRLGERE